MFENYRPLHFLAHYLDTAVFSLPTQTQFFNLIPSPLSNFYSRLRLLSLCAVVAVFYCSKIIRAQFMTK